MRGCAALLAISLPARRNARVRDTFRIVLSVLTALTDRRAGLNSMRLLFSLLIGLQHK